MQVDTAKLKKKGGLTADGNSSAGGYTKANADRPAPAGLALSRPALKHWRAHSVDHLCVREFASRAAVGCANSYLRRLRRSTIW